MVVWLLEGCLWVEPEVVGVGRWCWFVGFVDGEGLAFEAGAYVVYFDAVADGGAAVWSGVGFHAVAAGEEDSDVAAFLTGGDESFCLVSGDGEVVGGGGGVVPGAVFVWFGVGD